MVPQKCEQGNSSEDLEIVIGCDFGASAKAGDQAKKVILIEAFRLKSKEYVIFATGRNSRLHRAIFPPGSWRNNRCGWTIPELAQSLANDHAVTVSSFDFPFSIPMSLLQCSIYAKRLLQNPFYIRNRWADFVSQNLNLNFATNIIAKDRVVDLSNFANWRDKYFWIKRQTDMATGGSPPMKYVPPNVFSMTLAGTALLEFLKKNGRVKLRLSSVNPPNKEERIAFETYPAAIAKAIGFKGSYKQNPQSCLKHAEQYLKNQKIKLQFHPKIRNFCVTYGLNPQDPKRQDPDGADAFLCLVASICFRENLVKLCSNGANRAILNQEGCIITPIC